MSTAEESIDSTGTDSIIRAAKRDLMTILATAILTSAATCLILLATWQFSIALLGTIWLWAAGLAAIFYWGQLPRLLGFGSVAGAFEDSHHHFIEGPLTRFTKTKRFHSRNGG